MLLISFFTYLIAQQWEEVRVPPVASDWSEVAAQFDRSWLLPMPQLREAKPEGFLDLEQELAPLVLAEGNRSGVIGDLLAVQSENDGEFQGSDAWNRWLRHRALNNLTTVPTTANPSTDGPRMDRR